jgi:hypothetical protein
MFRDTGRSVVSRFDALSKVSTASRFSHKSTHVQIVDKKIQSLMDISPIPKRCSSLYLQQNQICNFLGLPDLPRITRIILDGNPVHSFEGCRRLPTLRFLSLRNTPISRNKYLKLMALVAFNGQLLKVNDEPIPLETREYAVFLQHSLFPVLKEGKIITNLKPLRVAVPKYHEHCAPDQQLIEASQFVGYTTPLDQKWNRAWFRQLMIQTPPTLAALWNHIVTKQQFPELPQSFCNRVYGQFLNLRDEINDAESEISEGENAVTQTPSIPLVQKVQESEKEEEHLEEEEEEEEEEQREPRLRDGQADKEEEEYSESVGSPTKGDKLRDEEEDGDDTEADQGIQKSEGEDPGAQNPEEEQEFTEEEQDEIGEEEDGVELSG